MLKWLPKELLGAVIVSLAIAVIALSLGGPPNSYEPSGPQGSQQTNSDQGSANELKASQKKCDPNCVADNTKEIRNTGPVMRIINKVIDDPVTSGILIANFLLVLAVLWQIIESRQSSERQLRAYITTGTGQSFRQGGTRGLRFEFRPNVINTGQTPAYNVQSDARVTFMTMQEASTFDFRVPKKTDPSTVTIGRRQDRFVHAIMDRRLTRAELRQFRRGSHYFFVHGTVWYRDIFGADQHTNFSYWIGWWPKRDRNIWHNVNHHGDSS